MTLIVPPWLARARDEIGFHETGNNRGIARYIEMAHCGVEGDPWCAIFANAMIEVAGLHGTRSASSQSFAHSALFRQVRFPLLGALAVFWRITRNSGKGHVGFVEAYGGNNRLAVLGGNEQDQVQIEHYPTASPVFGLVGFYVPNGYSEDNLSPAPDLVTASNAVAGKVI